MRRSDRVCEKRLLNEDWFVENALPTARIVEQHVVVDAATVAVNAKRMILWARRAKRNDDLSDNARFEAQRDEVEIGFGIFRERNVICDCENFHNLLIRKPAQQIDEVTPGINEWSGVFP